jgi:hypothetical protein
VDHTGADTAAETKAVLEEKEKMVVDKERTGAVVPVQSFGLTCIFQQLFSGQDKVEVTDKANTETTNQKSNEDAINEEVHAASVKEHAHKQKEVVQNAKQVDDTDAGKAAQVPKDKTEEDAGTPKAKKCKVKKCKAQNSGSIHTHTALWAIFHTKYQTIQTLVGEVRVATGTF